MSKEKTVKEIDVESLDAELTAPSLSVPLSPVSRLALS